MEPTYTLTQLTPELMKSVGVWVVFMGVTILVCRDWLNYLVRRFVSFFQGGF